MSKIFTGSALIGAAMSVGVGSAAAHQSPDLNYDKNAAVPAEMSEVCTPSDLAYLRSKANAFVVEQNVEFGDKDEEAHGYMQAYAELHAGDNAFEAYAQYSERALSHFKEFDAVAQQVERGMVSYEDVDYQIIGSINELGHLEQFYIQAHAAESIAAEFENHYGEGSFSRYSGMDIEVGEISCDIER
ncbi:MAG: hypothetical protein OSB62_02895 [Alphaproteobacteria bacterium]|nr:hypothetical protein [Alphaproteobacteria bacterium]